MKTDSKIEKRLIIGGLALLVAADIALATYSWQLSSASRTPQQEFAAQTTQLKLLQADIDRAQKIRTDIPKIQRDCDVFEHSLLPAATGYSATSAELDALSKKAGLQIDNVAFKQKEVPNRGVTEVLIEVTVAGEYTSIVKFLNGLQRSNNLYSVDSLGLASEASVPGQGPNGAIKVAMHMKTYFRTA